MGGVPGQGQERQWKKMNRDGICLHQDGMTIMYCTYEQVITIQLDLKKVAEILTASIFILTKVTYNKTRDLTRETKREEASNGDDKRKDNYQ